ncbi:tetratricopeptide tpr_1 repeat-containing protein : TPR repeat protein OS=Nodularia spumigena CCY9414 GN=N9414_11007 PE=4 SV=1: TPR_1 [Gemmata massiliana]|uniref:Uncharacterized protein n=2 Tax=Gemmata massiliana TaxID=1210884 RepID=A0A6P2DFS8_9BACT|nr:tetratricopeptide tpr_1 repeat-containing protein : TPR repeat protein OS=Nodularia spumigena CCY9414 GN=N9414_11007 PE=4 SV=1: TPR_1 [Gemmata massiliana]
MLPPLPPLALFATSDGRDAFTPLYEALPTLLVLAVSGGLGGFVAGIKTNSAHSVAIPFMKDRALNLGFFGDIVIGLTTGIAIMFLGSAMLGITDQQIGANSKAYDALRLVALGILSGFGGLRILTSLSDSQVTEKLTAINQKVDRNRKLGELLREAATLRAQSKYPESYLYYQRALEIDPTSEEAQVCAAVALSYIDEPNHYTDAVRDLEVIATNRNSARAYYNLACLKQLSTDKKVQAYAVDEVIRALRRAIELEPDRYRTFATEDNDLKSLWKNQEFIALVGPLRSAERATGT